MSTMTMKATANIITAKKFFAADAQARDFKAEWDQLDAAGKDQILAGLADGSLSY